MKWISPGHGSAVNVLSSAQRRHGTGERVQLIGKVFSSHSGNLWRQGAGILASMGAEGHSGENVILDVSQNGDIKDIGLWLEREYDL